MADRGGPTEQDRSEGTPSLSEGPDAGAKPFAYFSAFGKVSRRKGETISGRYRRNGYVLSQQNIGRLSGRHRQQAGSYKGQTDQSRKCPTIPFNSTPNCANSILDAAFPCIANED